MENDTYLTAQYKDRAQVKALGARWDSAQRSWYVPAGSDLVPFTAWLPAAMKLDARSNSHELSVSAPQGASEIAVVPPRGVTLSQLLAGVVQAVAQAYRAGVWTMVEVVDARLRSGHVYIEVSERDAGGGVAAKANAVIWANTASRILPEFERATGAKVGPGIKLLLRMRPVFKAQFGFSLEVDAIDPEYTLGDLEAKKREIRSRLQFEGLFDANKNLPAPWDFNAVLVVAPMDGAGLGDFRAEAERLERLGICKFVYVHSRFQGEGAAADIRDALLGAMDAWRESEGALPDAVVIIRGGGAVNDLAWLNNYQLARFICELDVPVLTGIGHERDSTVIDEVANIRFDTPSKVIGGIEQVIAKRVAETKAAYSLVRDIAARNAQVALRAVEHAEVTVKGGAQRQLDAARQRTAEFLADLRVGALRSVSTASKDARASLFGVWHLAVERLGDAKQSVPAFHAEVRLGANQALRTANAETDAKLGGILERSTLDARGASGSLGRVFQEVASQARRTISLATTQSESLIREVAGQGPEKTLGRGFALVRDGDRRPLSAAAQTKPGANIQIQFRDGEVAARTAEKREVIDK